jgi:hypothetical protein
MYLDEVMSGDHLDYVLGLHRDIYRHRTPIYSESAYGWNPGSHITVRRLFLPLTYGGSAPAITLIAQIFDIGTMPSASPVIVMLDNVVISELRREVLKVER